MPQHCRVRAFDRDLIRGRHYGQRSCEPHQQAEHMAAPIGLDVQKVLANTEPSTHGTKRTKAALSDNVRFRGQSCRRARLSTMSASDRNGLTAARHEFPVRNRSPKRLLRGAQLSYRDSRHLAVVARLMLYKPRGHSGNLGKSCTTFPYNHQLLRRLIAIWGLGVGSSNLPAPTISNQVNVLDQSPRSRFAKRKAVRCKTTLQNR